MVVCVQVLGKNCAKNVGYCAVMSQTCCFGLFLFFMCKFCILIKTMSKQMASCSCTECKIDKSPRDFSTWVSGLAMAVDHRCVQILDSIEMFWQCHGHRPSLSCWIVFFYYFYGSWCTYEKKRNPESRLIIAAHLLFGARGHNVTSGL